MNSNLPNLLDIFRPYQFGNGNDTFHIYQIENLEMTITGGLNLNLEASKGFDGSSRLNGNERAFKTDYIMNVSFLERNKKSLDPLYKIYNGKPRKLFFYKTDFTKNGGNNIDSIYFTRAEPASSPNHKYSASDTSETEIIQKSISLRFINPFIFKAKIEDLSFYNDSNVIKLQYNTGSTFNSGLTYNSGLTTLYPRLNTLNAKELFDFFETKIRDKALVINDRFLDVDQVLIREDFSTTLTNNLANDFILEDISTEQSFENKIYLIEIDSLNINETVFIENLTNNTNLLITCNESFTPVGKIIFNSYKRQFYDTGTQQTIDETKLTYNYINQQEMLKFSSTLTSRIQNPQSDTIRITKNTSGNLTFKLELLPIYN